MGTWEYTDGQGNKQQVTGRWTISATCVLMFRDADDKFIIAVKDWRDVYEIEEIE